MGWEYAWVHITYTIPLAAVLTLLFLPLCTRLDVYRILFLITVAVVYTIPWDSYLIRTGVWSYEDSVVLGPTLRDIPLEEVFFFHVQTYITSLVYLLASRHVVPTAYLQSTSNEAAASRVWTVRRLAGQVVIVAIILTSGFLLYQGGNGTYLGLILVWAMPVVLMLYTFNYQLLFNLPKTTTLLPILVPTLYLWVVDTLSLRNGTWVIASDTKTGVFVWPHLELEEAVFFLVTNTLVVFGQVAFDTAIAAIYCTDLHTDLSSGIPSPLRLVKALLVPLSQYDTKSITTIQEAIVRLQKKSRSFYLASSTFSGPLRLDLILLYSFCRAADDLVDESDNAAGLKWVQKLFQFLDIAYNPEEQAWKTEFVHTNFPPHVHTALLGLPVSRLQKPALVGLVDGLRMDLAFADAARPKLNGMPAAWPIADKSALEAYAHLVAGTVASLCLDLTYSHGISASHAPDPALRARLAAHGDTMGRALQLVNIARDVAADAALSRVYLPTDWLAAELITPADVLADPHSSAVRAVRMRTLARAFELYEEARPALDLIPGRARAGMRVAVESYMEIGRVMWESGCAPVRERGRATVPRGRRLRVALRALWA